MAAYIVHQLRGLCRNVYVVKRNRDASLHKSHCSILIKNNSQCSSLTCVSTSRGYHSNLSKEGQEQDQVHRADYPVPDIDDPFKEPIEPCLLCKNQVPLSYKNVQLLSQFVSPNTGRIYGRHITKLCHYQQKQVTRAIKRARQMGFMPYMYRETVFLKDPNLFDIRYTGNIDIALQEPSNLIQPETQPEVEESNDKK